MADNPFASLPVETPPAAARENPFAKLPVEPPRGPGTYVPPPFVKPPASFTTDKVGTGRQMGMTVESKGKLLTSAFFRIETVEGNADFSDLAGITSEVEQTEYMETGPVGALFSRHPGRSKPPTVVLKRGMKTGTGTLWIWTWHKLARMGAPGMLRDTALLLYGPQDDPGGLPRMMYMLMNAFPTKLELSGMKMGGTEVIVQTLTLQCDDIFDPNAA